MAGLVRTADIAPRSSIGWMRAAGVLELPVRGWAGLVTGRSDAAVFQDQTNWGNHVAVAARRSSVMATTCS